MEAGVVAAVVEVVTGAGVVVVVPPFIAFNSTLMTPSLVSWAATSPLFVGMFLSALKC